MANPIDELEKRLQNILDIIMGAEAELDQLMKDMLAYGYEGIAMDGEQLIREGVSYFYADYTPVKYDRHGNKKGFNLGNIKDGFEFNDSGVYMATSVDDLNLGQVLSYKYDDVGYVVSQFLLGIHGARTKVSTVSNHLFYVGTYTGFEGTGSLKNILNSFLNNYDNMMTKLMDEYGENNISKYPNLYKIRTGNVGV